MGLIWLAELVKAIARADECAEIEGFIETVSTVSIRQMPYFEIPPASVAVDPYSSIMTSMATAPLPFISRGIVSMVLEDFMVATKVLHKG